MSNTDIEKYADIINLSRPVSDSRAKMPLIDRAAQFSPFAALTGYDSAVAEVARYTEQQVELSDSEREELDRTVKLLSAIIDTHPQLTVTYFIRDGRKQGGKYLRATARLVRIDDSSLTLDTGEIIPKTSITRISTDNFVGILEE